MSKKKTIDILCRDQIQKTKKVDLEKEITEKKEIKMKAVKGKGKDRDNEENCTTKMA